MTTAALEEAPATTHIIRRCPELHVHLHLDRKPYTFRCGPPESRTFLMGHVGSTEPPYQVFIADQDSPDNDTCTCPDFTNRVVVCKHIRAVRAFFGKIAQTFS